VLEDVLVYTLNVCKGKGGDVLPERLETRLLDAACTQLITLNRRKEKEI